MKTVLFLLFSISAHAWINEVSFIHGKIRSYDQKTVQIETETESVAHVPRSAIPEKFKIAALSSVVAVPIYSSRTGEIKWQSSKGLRIAKIDDEQDEIFKELEQEYQRIIKARRAR